MASTYCSKSWTDVVIDLHDRTVKHCCKSVPYDFPEKLTIDFINNSERIQERRQQSIEGIEHPDCIGCWKNQKSGNWSYRDWVNKWDDKEFERLKPFLNDPLVKYIEIKLDNICDMSCLYCFADSSSKIAQEEKTKVKSKFNEHDYMILKEWISTYLAKINHEVVFNFIGGEATASMKFYEFIDHIELEAKKNPNLDIVISICTNANTKKFLMEKLLNTIESSSLKWNIAISNEAIGKDAELVRYGLDWERFQTNVIQYMSHPKIKGITFAPTLNVLNFKSFPKYVKWVHETFDKHKSNDISLSWVGNQIDNPECLNVATLPKSFITYLNEAHDFVNNYIGNPNYHDLDRFITFIKSIKTSLGTVSYDHKNLKKFIKYKEKVKNTKELSALLKNLS